MAVAGRKLGEVLRAIAPLVCPGAIPREIDAAARREMESRGAVPAFLGYHPQGARHPYPASICFSVNDGVVHGVPGSVRLREGDVVKIDAGLVYKGMYADSAVTLGVGAVSQEAQKLMAATKESLAKAIEAARAGNTVGDVGYAIERSVRAAGFSVAEMLTGHGIGRELHEEPSVPNSGKKGKGRVLEAGMVLAIEPMVSAGSGRIRQLKDESYATADGSLAAHFEHTVAITNEGPRVLTEI